MLYQITHNMPPEHPNYVLLIAGIQSLRGDNDCIQVFQNSWLVDTPVETAERVFQLLAEALTPGVCLMVLPLLPEHTAGYLPPHVNAWLLSKRKFPPVL